MLIVDEYIAVRVVLGRWPVGTPDAEDDAARLATRYGGGLRNAEILAAGIANHAELWFGSPTNVGPTITDGAAGLGVAVHVATN